MANVHDALTRVAEDGDVSSIENVRTAIDTVLGQIAELQYLNPYIADAALNRLEDGLAAAQRELAKGSRWSPTSKEPPQQF